MKEEEQSSYHKQAHVHVVIRSIEGLLNVGYLNASRGAAPKRWGVSPNPPQDSSISPPFNLWWLFVEMWLSLDGLLVGLALALVLLLLGLVANSVLGSRSTAEVLVVCW